MRSNAHESKDFPGEAAAVSLDAALLLALRMQRGIGDSGVRRIVAGACALGVPLESLFGKPSSWLTHRFPAAQAQALAACDRAALSSARQCIKNARARAVYVLCMDDPAYPETLAAAMGAAAPVLLFAQGGMELLQRRGAAVVGRRNPSASGARLADATARRLAADKLAVVSGGAQGVDTAAHQAALEAGGNTVVVLPQGIFSYHPPVFLRKAVDAGVALFLSVFPPESPWRTPLAVMRNEIISALSEAVYVIEPGRPGGSQLTGLHGLRQKKPVYCCPCPGRPSPYDPALEIPSPYSEYRAYCPPHGQAAAPVQARLV